MSSQAENGRRAIIKGVAPVGHGVSVAKVIPVWGASAVINVVLVLGGYFVLSFLAEAGAAPPEQPELKSSTEVEAPDKDKALDNFDVGEDETQETNYLVEKIDEVSVPGRVDPTADSGIKDGPPDVAKKTLPPPPGSGGGTGGALKDLTNPGGGSPFGELGGMGGKYVVGGFDGRTASTRKKLLAEGGGSDASEASVAKGLKWLALHQAQDGHWGLHDFNRSARTAPYPGGKVSVDKCPPETSLRNDTAGTAFGLLPFLAAGITNKPPAKRTVNDYHKTVKAGLDWLIARQVKVDKDPKTYGSFRGGMYAHGLATIAMCEAYALTGDPRLKASAQLAIAHLVRAQHPGGGWRYEFEQAGDTSVVGWCVMAIKSGQMAGLTIPKKRSGSPDPLDLADKYLDAAEVKYKGSPSGGYTYTPGGRESPAMSAVGLLCRMYLGYGPRNAALQKGVTALKKHPPGSRNDLYYDYYATQVMHHMEGDAWKFWNLGPEGDGKGGIRDTLIAKQITGKGPAQDGSWAVEGDAWGRSGGRMMMTSLSLLTLEVYYRHLPLYRRPTEAMKKD